MLLTMKAFAEGNRAMVYFTAKQVDIVKYAQDEEQKKAADGLLAFLTPIAKAFMTEVGFESASHGMQVYGGHGFISEWGMEQNLRDCRIAMMYEGTTGVQALDLLGRKVLMEGGRGLQLLAGRINATIERAIQVPALAAHANALGKALQDVGAATKAAWATGQPADALANAVPYMQAFGHTVLALSLIHI